VLLVLASAIWLFFSWDEIETQMRLRDKEPFFIHMHGLIMVFVEAIVRVHFRDTK
jgi:nitrate/TMAO reductase-like tetraheme cytochrome c subunit